MQTLRLKRGRDRPQTHPWIFKGDVADVGDAAAGSVVTVVDAGGRFVGQGHFNPRPALCCRILTRTEEPIDGAFYRRRLQAALALRTDAATAVATADQGPARRLVWSEGDLLPGLVVDRYAGVLVVQCLTLAMASARAEIVRVLREVLGDLPVFALDDPVGARLEGFEPLRQWLDRHGPGRVVVEESAVRFRVTLGTGHKTGLYLDQAENRRRAGALGRDRTVLDAFAYTAGFACHALLGGARGAVCLESSPEAIAGARENLGLNGVEERAEIRGVNVFDELRRLERTGERFGLVVLDPPPFARSRDALEAARRGYKEINLRAMRLLEPGGHLMTFSCSHHVGEVDFEEICREAAADAGITLRLVGSLPQAPDHPVLLTVPETRYLAGRLLQAM